MAYPMGLEETREARSTSGALRLDKPVNPYATAALEELEMLAAQSLGEDPETLAAVIAEIARRDKIVLEKGLRQLARVASSPYSI